MLFNIYFQKWSKVTVKENDKTIYSKITSVLIAFVAYLVKNFISRLEACSEAVLFASFGDSLCDLLERFSFEYRKTKTKIITLANHKGHRQYSEPIKTRSNYM